MCVCARLRVRVCVWRYRGKFYLEASFRFCPSFHKSKCCVKKKYECGVLLEVPRFAGPHGPSIRRHAKHTRAAHKPRHGVFVCQGQVRPPSPTAPHPTTSAHIQPERGPRPAETAGVRVVHAGPRLAPHPAATEPVRIAPEPHPATSESVHIEPGRAPHPAATEPGRVRNQHGSASGRIGSGHTMAHIGAGLGQHRCEADSQRCMRGDMCVDMMGMSTCVQTCVSTSVRTCVQTCV